MEALGGGLGGLWGLNSPFRKRADTRSKSNSKPSDSVEATGRAGYRFPLKQAVTAGSLALAGDTIAQLSERWRKGKALNQNSVSNSHGYTKVRGALWFFLFSSLSPFVGVSFIPFFVAECLRVMLCFPLLGVQLKYLSVCLASQKNVV